MRGRALLDLSTLRVCLAAAPRESRDKPELPDQGRPETSESKLPI